MYGGHMLEIRPATETEYPAVKGFYDSLIDEMENAEFGPGWKKDIYPAPEFLIDSIRRGELYIGIMDKAVVSCMVLNHECNDGYKEVKWSVAAEDADVFVIHALGVTPKFGRRGIAKSMVQKAFDEARRRHIHVLRLDVLQGNTPAAKAYSSMGFQSMGTVQMFYEDTGWADFEMFEYVLEDRTENSLC